MYCILIKLSTATKSHTCTHNKHTVKQLVTFKEMTKYSPGSQLPLCLLYMTLTHIQRISFCDELTLRQICVYLIFQQTRKNDVTDTKLQKCPGKGLHTRTSDLAPFLKPDPSPANWKANTSPFKAAHTGRAAVNAQLPTAHTCASAQAIFVCRLYEGLQQK